MMSQEEEDQWIKCREISIECLQEKKRMRRARGVSQSQSSRQHQQPLETMSEMGDDHREVNIEDSEGVPVNVTTLTTNAS